MESVDLQSVSIYACGITPYSDAHVGHARTYVVFDQLARALRRERTDVRLVRNITDVDDKIIDAARREGVHWSTLSNRYAHKNRGLMLETGLLIPEEPKASEYIDDIIVVIDKLIALGFAYPSSTGDVLYNVGAYKGKSLVQHARGASKSEQGQSRVNTDGKRDVRDFSLWKTMLSDEPGFPSPWGWGRPGWHIECTAMIGSLFGGHVTIHGGGVDLKFPHHQSEIMQSEPVFNKKVADIWMHNGSVLSNGVKMSKSLGNVVLWSDALEKANIVMPGRGGDILRYAMLKTHWSQPLDWTSSILTQSALEIGSLVRKAWLTRNVRSDQSFFEILGENFNTPKAFGWLHHMAKAGKGASVLEGLQALGIDAHAWSIDTALAQVFSADIALLVKQRDEARALKKWEEADAIRLQLQERGIALNDVSIFN